MRLSRLRRCLALCLSATLLSGGVPMYAGRPVAPVAKAVPVDHATLLVDRFTFGPTPGEIDRVRAMGAERWFEQQLAPERIPDDALDARLAVYPAMEMSQDERIERYPTPNQIRQLAKTGALPQDPTLRAIVADQVEFYQERQKAKPVASTGATGVLLVAGSGNSRTDTITGIAGPMAATTPAPIVRVGTDGVQTPVPAMAAAAVPAPGFEQAIAPMPQMQVDGLLALPADARYDRVLHLPVDQLIALRKGLRNGEGKLSDGMTPLQKETLASLSGTNRMITGELFGSRLLRDIYSSREVEAVMTDFWLNHFNIYIKKDGQMPSLLPQFQQTVQQHALGRFEDLLLATARSPAMLMYLDNAQSAGPDSIAAGANPRNPNAKKKKDVGLNENYARELMELHTLGVNGGYTQTDVTEVAKVFTGWTTERPADGGQFTFNERRHEPGDKRVLGRTIHENGQREGEQVLHLLATSPATAHFLSLELAERFVADTPPPAMVDRMAATFLQSGGDIRAVLRTMVHSPEFFTAATLHAKLKTPLEYVVSAVRVTGADVQNPQPLAQSLERLGMPLYGCQPPTGYKWDAETWLSSSALVNRMNFSLLLSSNRVAGTTVALPALLADGRPAAAPDADAPGKELALETALLDTPASAQTRSAVLGQADDSAVQQAARDFQAVPQGRQPMAGKRVVPVAGRALGQAQPRQGPPPADKQGSVMLGLLLGSPEFQKR